MMKAPLYDETSLSAWFRAMYHIPEAIAVFDRVMPFVEDELHQTNDSIAVYWVHVHNSSPEWDRELREDLRRTGSDITFPEGFNNVADVSESPFDGKMKVFVHYRLCAPGLPANI